MHMFCNTFLNYKKINFNKHFCKPYKYANDIFQL